MPSRRFFCIKKASGGTCTAARPEPRLSAGACTVTPRTRSWKICSFAFRTAPNTAQSAPHRFPRSEQRETVGRLRPRSDRSPGGAGSRNQQPHPFPPTFGFSGTGAKAGRSGSSENYPRSARAAASSRGNEGGTLAGYFRSGSDWRT